jgi:hypothetical protein
VEDAQSEMSETKHREREEKAEDVRDELSAGVHEVESKVRSEEWDTIHVLGRPGRRIRGSHTELATD